ncbi:tRNA lysidine(34) synthetase TilS [Maribellus luteus]|uniref:tRNA(Ile)-lysidine synthase n=1 Tax=Maribellus luteus TaxID=2305463 RepID=A0A399SYM2_9BACT|nr:tRNA lysidine(34) synthetase TilS [Maribellus luteus]RIJ47181.1 tRNA lysidine(34) synthetase TilS [Maribellus luteus]
MLKNFIQNIKEKGLIAPDERVLLAVSGGIDSMVLLHLFEQSGFEYGVAHCNFRLRGEESDGDERFVREYVQMHGIPSFFETFDTEEYARISGISIEMAARELRYAFFERIRRENNYDRIVTAHHQDDLIETFFLNLSRKTGIKGLTGIKEKSGYLIRPLLLAGRAEIEQYAAQNYLDYREDSTNNEVVYQRNFLRHKILPLFNELNPAFKKNLLASIDNLRDAEQVYTSVLNRDKEEVVEETNDEMRIDIEKLRTTEFPHLLLLEVLSPLHFNPSVIDEVFQSLDAEPGKQFFSATHRLVKDRAFLFVAPIKEPGEQLYYIEEADMELFEPVQLSIEKTVAAGFKIVKSPDVACIDLDTIQFPLLIRKWKQGDYFQPLGMQGMKKISDFFIDQKIPLHEKENTWLLCSGKKIVWIMGHRLDDRFKVTNKTQKVLVFRNLSIKSLF